MPVKLNNRPAKDDCRVAQPLGLLVLSLSKDSL